MELEKYLKNVFACERCGVCAYKYNSWSTHRVCPVYEHSAGFEPYNPRGKNAVARGILEGVLNYTPSLVNVLTACTTCMNCVVQCGARDDITGEYKIKTPEVVEAMRADIVNLGLAPHAYKTISSRIEKNKSPYPEPKEERWKWAEVLNVSFNKAKTMYYVGCTSCYRRTEVATATVKILNKLGIPFGILKDEWCCGSTLLRTGQKALAEEMARHNVEELKDAETVITSCAGCLRAFRKDYPKMGLEVPFNVVHITEFLSGLMDEGKLKLEKPVAKKVTYHDPCHIGRHLEEFGIYDEPRKVLKAIPGIEFKEVFMTRENTWCCGAGGGMKIAHPDMAVEIATDRLKHAQEVDAEAIVSSCPFCKTNLADAVKATGSKLEIYDITELIEKSLGI
jgi:heterodisulfide reductase subunit D